MTHITFNPITYGAVSFTNISVDETDTGTVSPFSSNPGVAVGVSTQNGPALAWLGANAGVYYANSTEVLNFNYTVTAAAGQFIAAGQQYAANLFTGPGISLKAVENVYGANNALVASNTFTLGQSNPASFQLSAAQQSINVQITLTLSIGNTGSADSAVVLSAIQQSFTYQANTASIGDIVFFDSAGTGLESGFDAGPGVPGVTVELLDGTGTSILATTTTDATGRYQFSSLAAGVYEVAFISPTGYHFSPQGVGGAANAAINSSANATTGITGPITLTAGQAYHNAEAGLVPGGSASGAAPVSGVVFTDTNGDGVLDNGESGTPGVTVQLLNAAGTSVVATTTTNASGTYSFSSVSPGNYEISIVAPANEAFSTASTTAITVANGNAVTTPSVGVYTPATVSGAAYLDTNRDGTQDNGEAGASGVTIELLNAAGTSVIATTTTNASGSYAFSGIQPGTYQVAAIAPAGEILTTQGAGSAFGANGLTGPVTLTSGQALNDNAGFQYAPSTVTGTVFTDTNGNGTQDSGEAGAAGVTVQLLNAAGTSVIATTTTGSGGTYSFGTVNPGSYEVKVLAPSGQTAEGSGLTAPFTLAAGGTATEPGIGVYTPATVSGTAYLDANRDGTQDNNEGGITGVTIELLNAAGTSVIATTTTGTGGSYSFAGIQPGTYQVEAIAPAGDILTTQGAGSAFGANGLTGPVTLTSGQTLNDNAGFQSAPATVTGTVFTDSNGDGTQNNGEAGAAGVTVQLLNAAGTSVIATTTTGANGTYSFSTVNPGSYEVKVVPPAGAVAEGGGTTAPFTLAAGGTATEPGQGIYTPASVAGQVWLDNNGDGLLDNGEAGITGVTVQLLNAAGTSVLATTTTGSGGSYSFSGLAPAGYEVKVAAPAGDVFTTQSVAGAIDSAVNSSTGVAAFTLGSGAALNASAGVYAPASITGRAFSDGNRDSVQDSNEPGLSGLTVQLWNAAETSVLATTSTASDGTYSFSNLAPGNYEVSFQTLPGDTFSPEASSFILYTSAVNAAGFSLPITLTSGYTQGHVDAGYVAAPTPPPAPACISGEEWLDKNANGLLESNEQGVAGQTVSLLSDTLTLKISEDAYLGDAQYTVSVNGVQIGGTYTATALHNQGQDNTLTLNGIWGASACVTVNFLNDAYSGTAQTDRNLYVDGITYNGVNQNQSYIEYCAGPVTTSECSGIALQTIATTTTNASGAYSFMNLNPGTYEVAFTAPSGDVFTTQGVGGNPANDSSANPCNGITSPITVTAGQCNMSVNAGVYGLATISGNTFIDNNGNGAFDSGEALLANPCYPVCVTLWNATGTVALASVTTTSGSYSFGNLTPGAYEVSFSDPSGFVRTVQGATGVTSGNYSLDNPTTGFTAPVTLTSGQTVGNVDAGFYQPATIGGGAFADGNRDGIIDSNESLLTGITVTLWNAAETSVIATTTTDCTGTYLFSNLAPGNYEVSFQTLPGDTFSPEVASFTTLHSAVNAAGFSLPITLTSGSVQYYVDAGYVAQPMAALAPASLGGEVWLDGNGNGLLDSSEAGVAGATVSLLSDTLTLKISEDAYLGDAQYTVSVNGVQVGGTYTATALHGLGQDNTLTLNGIWGGTPTVTVNYINNLYGGTAQTDRNLYVDGITYNGTNQNKSWSETTNGPVSTSLSGAAEPVLATTTTNALGQYSFTNLNPGAYEVAFTSPSGDQFTTQGVGGNPANDSSANKSTGITAPITVTAGQNNTSVNAGVYAPAAITSEVWLDSNGNGLLDNGETGVSGVTVKLLNATGTSVLATTTTNSSGTYSFTALTPGVGYEVQVLAPSGDAFTVQGISGSNTSAVNSAGVTAPVTLVSGQSDTALNAGLAQATGIIAGSTWIDYNGTGVIVPGDGELAGVTLQLLNAATGSVLATQVSTLNTSWNLDVYAFTGLTAGVYEVKAITPNGYTLTTANTSVYNGDDSNFSQSTGLTAPITLTPGGQNVNVLAGFTPLDTISGNVFLDANRNGVNGSGDPAVAGVTVQLWNAAATSVLATTTTNSSGNYSFSNLANGTYEVSFVPPAGDTFTTQGPAFGSTDSSVNPSTGFTPAITLGTGQTQANVNAGLLASAASGTASIGNFVWLDSNANGIQDPTEKGVAGATVSLLTDTLVLKISEDAYAGDAQYTVAVNGVQVGGTYTATAAHSAGQDNTLTLNGIWGGTPTVTVTFLNDYYLPLFGDRNLYVDGITYNGVNQNKSWAEMSGGPVGTTLSAANLQTIAVTTTNASGYYNFSNLNPGAYEVAFTAPAGDVFTTQGVGGNPAVNSSANQSTGITAPITVTAGQNDTSVDAGVYQAGGITGFAFQDLNRNGVFNSGEPYVGGLTVTLWNAAGTSVLATTTTNSSGGYTFANLQPGTYQVSISAISGETLDAQGIGGNAAIDSAFNPGTGFTGALTVTSGQTLQVNAGYLYSSAAVSSFVFYDNNANGIYDSGDGLAAGVTVDLWNGTGTSLIAVTTTNSAGQYTFAGLNPGNYEVSVALPGGYNFDPYHATPSGYTAANQSDVNQSTGFSPAFTLTAGQSLSNTLNAGLQTTAKSTASLSVLKVPSATVVNQCGQVTYTFTVTNTGTTALTNVCIVDNIGSAAKPDYVAPKLVTTGTNGTLAAGATWTYTETVNQINSTLNNCGTLTHTCSGNYLTAGNTAWFSSSFNPASCANGATYKFQDVSCVITGSGLSSPITVNCGDAVVQFSSSCTSATTVWNASQNCWITTLPAGCNPGNVFLSGCPVTIPNGCNLTNATCTWTVGDSSNNCGASNLNWSASGCGYSTFNANGCNGLQDYNNIGVKSCDNLGGSWFCGAPVNQCITNNCGNTSLVWGTGSASQNCGTGSSGTPSVMGAADTVTVTATTTTCGQATASDTKEVEVLGANSNVSVGGTVPTGVLSTLYGTPTTLEFLYTAGNSVSSGASGSVSGTNALSTAYMVIQNAAGSSIYFQGAVTSGENIFADASLNPLTNTPVAGGTFPSTDGNTGIIAKIYASQAAFQAGTGPVQTDTYNGVTGTMHLGDTIGSIQLVGYVGSTGGHLV